MEKQFCCNCKHYIMNIKSNGFSEFKCDENLNRRMSIDSNKVVKFLGCNGYEEIKKETLVLNQIYNVGDMVEIICKHNIMLESKIVKINKDTISVKGRPHSPIMNINIEDIVGIKQIDDNKVKINVIESDEDLRQNYINTIVNHHNIDIESATLLYDVLENKFNNLEDFITEDIRIFNKIDDAYDWFFEDYSNYNDEILTNVINGLEIEMSTKELKQKILNKLTNYTKINDYHIVWYE